MSDTNDELKVIAIKKDAGVAAVLNTILPDLGWIYCEKIWGGIISIITNIGLIYGSLFAFHISSYSYNNYDYRLNFSIIYLLFWILHIVLIKWFLTGNITNEKSKTVSASFLIKNRRINAFLFLPLIILAACILKILLYYILDFFDKIYYNISLIFR